MSEQATSNPLGGQHKGEGGAMSEQATSNPLGGQHKGEGGTMSQQATSNPLGGQHKGEGGTMSQQATSNRLTGSDSVDTVSIKSMPSKGGWRPKQTAGLILILVGIIFLLANLGFLWWWNWGTMWPTIIIGIGLFILARNVNLRVRT